MSDAPDLFRQNNFDLVRLAAALQVLVLHAIEHLALPVPAWLHDLLARFPGVPVFFMVSGFLVSRSYDRHPDLALYLRNRALRIYPALLVCLAFSLATVAAVGYLRTVTIHATPFAVWLAAQLTIAQFYRAPFLDGYATGTLNGSLWTIPVELQFYLILPLVVAWARRRHRPTRALLALVAVFVVANVVRYLPSVADSNDLGSGLLKMSFVPYFYLFLVGVVAQRELATLRRYVEGRAIVWLAGYLVLSYGVSALSATLGWTGLATTENPITPLCAIPLAALALSVAMTHPTVSDRLVRRQDLSYGVYIYHMPIINVLVYVGVIDSARSVGVMLAATALCAWMSWHWIERPALSRKRHALRPVVASV